MSMRTRKKSADRKAEIVAAMLTLVAEMGPGCATTQAVADRVGVTQAGVFRHFPAKKDLWIAVADWLIKEAQERWAKARNCEKSPLDGIKCVIEAQLEFIQHTPAVHSLIFSRELHAQNDELRRSFYSMSTDFHVMLTELAKEAQIDGELSSDFAPHEIANVLLTLPSGLATRWSLSGRTFNLAKEGARLLEILLYGMSKVH